MPRKPLEKHSDLWVRSLKVILAIKKSAEEILKEGIFKEDKQK